MTCSFNDGNIFFPNAQLEGEDDYPYFTVLNTKAIQELDEKDGDILQLINEKESEIQKLRAVIEQLENRLEMVEVSLQGELLSQPPHTEGLKTSAVSE